ncbi:hypothetical protein V1514DRAFT_288413 [Lipomyces japonicus]|uniref:uncharacterized protein n=1 Tax=Lipomyces japonicus TaxID=56871 RepID=UPI0034CD2C1C
MAAESPARPKRVHSIAFDQTAPLLSSSSPQACNTAGGSGNNPNHSARTVERSQMATQWWTKGILSHVNSWILAAVHKLGLSNILAVPDQHEEEHASKRLRTEELLRSPDEQNERPPSPGSFPQLNRISSPSISPPQSPVRRGRTTATDVYINYPPPLQSFKNTDAPPPRYPKFVRLDQNSPKLPKSGESSQPVAQVRSTAKRPVAKTDLRKRVLLKKDPLKEIRASQTNRSGSARAMLLQDLVKRRMEAEKSLRPHTEGKGGAGAGGLIDFEDLAQLTQESGNELPDQLAEVVKKDVELSTQALLTQPSEVTTAVTEDGPYGAHFINKHERRVSETRPDRKELVERLRRRRRLDSQAGNTRYTAPSANALQPNETPFTPAQKQQQDGIMTTPLRTPRLPLSGSSGRVEKYKSPFKNAGSVERLRKTASAYRDGKKLSLLRNSILSASRNQQSYLSVSSSYIESITPSIPTNVIFTKTRSPPRPISSNLTDSQSLDELIKQIIREGSASDFPAWVNVQKKRAARLDAIKKYRAPPDVIKPLTGLQLAKVEAILKSRSNSRQVLVTGFRIDITGQDARTLADRQWLNDNVIDFYLQLITERSRVEAADGMPRSFVYTTHFYSTLRQKGYQGVARWAKRQKLVLAETDFVFVPVNIHNTHWCVSVINLRDRRFEYYDSLGGGPGKVFDDLREYLTNEAVKQEFGVIAHDNAEWDEFIPENSPMQQNGYDCGVFTCKTVEVLARDGNLTFSQKDMPILRRRMLWEILDKRLLT